MRDMLASVKGPQGGTYTTTCKIDLTYSGVKNAISTAFAGADSNDVSLFFFATHGVTNLSSGTYAGALCTYDDDYIPIADLADWLSAVPGTVIVMLGSCGSGAAIYPDMNKNTSSAGSEQAFVESVIQTFAAKDVQVNRYQPNLGELRTSKFYVLAAARHQESSLGHEGSDACNLFAEALVAGVTGSMSADRNNDNKVSLHEAYLCIEEAAEEYHNWPGGSGLPAGQYQHTQEYPVNSSYALFAKK